MDETIKQQSEAREERAKSILQKGNPEELDEKFSPGKIERKIKLLK